MLTLSNPWMKLFIQSDNKQFEVKTICKTTGEANVIMGLNPSLGIICEDDKTGLIFLAEMSPTDKTTIEIPRRPVSTCFPRQSLTAG